MPVTSSTESHKPRVSGRIAGELAAAAATVAA